jgi:uncharacterized membrane protein YoaK (UPF0700 family)
MFVMAAGSLFPGGARAEAVAPPSATVAVDAAVPASAFTLPDPAPAPAATVYTESVLRRTETVFLIALPFTTLYSALLSASVALAIEGKKFTVDSRVVVPAVSLALAATSYVAWRDHRAAPPPSSPP